MPTEKQLEQIRKEFKNLISLLLITFIILIITIIFFSFLFNTRIESIEEKSQPFMERTNITVEPSKDVNTNKSYDVISLDKPVLNVESYHIKTIHYKGDRLLEFNTKMVSSSATTKKIIGKGTTVSVNLIGISLPKDMKNLEKAEHKIKSFIENESSYAAIQTQKDVIHLNFKFYKRDITQIAYSKDDKKQWSAYLFNPSNPSSTSLQSELVAQGLAKVDATTIPRELRNDKLTETLIASEQIAKDKHLGVWLK